MEQRLKAHDEDGRIVHTSGAPDVKWTQFFQTFRIFNFQWLHIAPFDSWIFQIFRQHAKFLSLHSRKAKAAPVI